MNAHNHRPDDSRTAYPAEFFEEVYEDDPDYGVIRKQFIELLDGQPIDPVHPYCFRCGDRIVLAFLLRPGMYEPHSDTWLFWRSGGKCESCNDDVTQESEAILEDMDVIQLHKLQLSEYPHYQKKRRGLFGRLFRSKDMKGRDVEPCDMPDNYSMYKPICLYCNIGTLIPDLMEPYVEDVGGGTLISTYDGYCDECNGEMTNDQLLDMEDLTKHQLSKFDLIRSKCRRKRR